MRWQVGANAKMRWLIAVIVGHAIVFYLCSLWALYRELKHLRKTSVGPIRQPVARTNLFRLDLADLWKEKSPAEMPDMEEEL